MNIEKRNIADTTVTPTPFGEIREYYRAPDNSVSLAEVVMNQDGETPVRTHKRTTKVITVKDGTIRIALDNGVVDAETGDFIVIPIGTRHIIHSRYGAVYEVVCRPAFDPTDV